MIGELIVTSQISVWDFLALASIAAVIGALLGRGHHG